ncbi:MAG: hypothetical protein ABIN36_07440 [Ferruginibacter sp.]
MNIDQYKIAAEKFGYKEEAIFHEHPEEYLKDFVDYKNTTVDLKIYLCELIIYRHFMAMGAIINPDDVNWFIQEYFSYYDADYILPDRTKSIKEAKELIMSGDIFGKAPIGAVFMYGIIEFYAKYKLGFRPNKYDFFDFEKHSYTKQFTNKDKPQMIFIKEALDFLTQGELPISLSLRRIDSKTVNKMNELFIEERRFVYFGISDRLRISRNAMVHGENYSFFDRGRYMLMLYILFQLNELKENGGIINKCKHNKVQLGN